MKLIVNADDFGLTKSITDGIIDGFLNGVVTSTTLMVTMPAAEYASIQSKKYPELGIGLHFNIAIGKPLTDCKSLLGENGMFIKPRDNKFDDKNYLEEDIYKELSAQYDLFIKLMGKKPTHIDSHLYVHQVYLKVKRVVKKFAEEKNLPVRDLIIKSFPEVYFYDTFKVKDNDITKALDALCSDTKIIQNDYMELMCHPAFVDDELMKISSYSSSRELELDALKSEEIIRWIRQNKITLISYQDVKERL